MVDVHIKMAKVSNKASVSVCTSNQTVPRLKKFFCPDLHDVTKRGYHQRRHDNSTFS